MNPASMTVAERSADEAHAKATAAPNRVVANVAFLGLSQVTTWMLTLVWTIFVPRALGPAGTGLLVLAWSANGLLLAICGLGGRTMLTRAIAADRTRASRLLGAAMIVRAVSCIPCFALVFMYIRLGHFGSSEVLVLYLAAFMAALNLFLEPAQAAFQGIERMQYLAYGEMINKAVATLVGVPLVLLGFDGVALVWLMVAAVGVVLVLSWRWLRECFAIDWRPILQEIWRFLRESLAFWAYTIFFTVYLWADSAMLGLLVPMQVLGWYGVPTRLFGSLLFAATILGTAWMPRFAVASTEGQERVKQVVRQPLELAFILSLPICVGTIIVSEPLVSIVYGSSFAPAVPVLMILAATIIPMYLNIIIGTMMVAIGRQGLWTGVLAGAGVFNILSNYVLIELYQSWMRNGAIGSALALLATELLIVVGGGVMARRYLSLASLDRVARGLLVTAGMAAGALVAGRFGVFAQVVIGAGMFSGLALLLRLVTPSERMYVQRHASKVFGRVGSWLRFRTVRAGATTE